MTKMITPTPKTSSRRTTATTMTTTVMLIRDSRP
jgi:hypothetical protein